MNPRLVVAMTGATGAVYGVRLLEALHDTPVETHVVVSEWARKTIAIETDRRPDDVLALATRVYREGNQAAAISSGSFRTMGMVVAPCSMKTLAGIAYGFADNLIVRAAEVTMKESRKLMLLVRESPLSVIHLENMLTVARAGAVIAPPAPAFYANPASVEEMVDQTVGRVLDQFDIEHSLLHRWGERRGDDASEEDTGLVDGRRRAYVQADR
ncbi:MAG: UbiX family flavin prenyltransferase [Streptosporangiales bacterium]